MVIQLPQNKQLPFNLSIFSAGFQQKSKQDTHSPSCLFARLSSPSTDMPAINWKRIQKTYHKEWLCIANMQTMFVKFIQISIWLRRSQNFTKQYTNKESQQLEGTSGYQFCSDKGSQTLEEKPLPLYCLALCNRHSWWGRWHRRRICHNFVAEAATVTIGTSALQNVTANGPADRKSKHSLRSQS